jgi:hypothetical protein
MSLTRVHNLSGDGSRPSSGRAQIGEKPPFPGATAQWHQGSVVVRSLLKLLGPSSGNPVRICCKCIT